MNLNNFLYKNHEMLLEVFFMGLLLWFWVENIFPLLEIFQELDDARLVLSIAGFVFFSLIAFLFVLPYWFRSWIFTIIELTYKAYLIVNRRISHA